MRGIPRIGVTLGLLLINDSWNGHHHSNVTMTPAADTLRLFVLSDRFTSRLQIVINGHDLTEGQRPLSHRGEPLLFMSPRCTQVLPPDTAAMLPTTRPTQAMVAVCNCGEAGCNSLWVRVRRAGDRVVWEPDDASPRRTVDRSWSFELLPYLQAIDDAAAASHRLETRADALARELRRRRDSLFGFAMGTREQIFTLCDAYSWWDPQGHDTGPCLGIQVAGAGGLSEYLVPLPTGRSDDDILNELRNFHPERYRNAGRAPWVPDPPWPPAESRRQEQE